MKKSQGNSLGYDIVIVNYKTGWENKKDRYVKHHNGLRVYGKLKV